MSVPFGPPSPAYRKQKLGKQRIIAADTLRALQELRLQHAQHRSKCRTLRDQIAWAATRDDLDACVRIWRLELHRAQVAFRIFSPIASKEGAQ